MPEEQAVDQEAASRASYLKLSSDRETLFDPSGVDVRGRTWLLA
jgi:hypothetical protein